MESPALIWIPHGSRDGQPALPRRPRDGPPVVLRAGRQRPVDPALRRRGRRRLRRSVRPWDCAARAAARRRRWTARSTSTRPPATTRRSTSRAATCSTTPARRWARPRSGRRSAATSRRNRYGIARDDLAAGRARCGDAASTSGRRCSSRGSPGCRRPARRRASSRHGPPRSIRASAASAFGIWRQAGGMSGRQTRHPATSQAETARSRAPQANPYSSRTVAGSSPSDGHSVQLYATGGIRDRIGAAAGMSGASGGWRMTCARSRASGPGWTGPDGATIAATYASKAARSLGSSASGTPNARPIGRVSWYARSRRSARQRRHPALVRRPASSRRAWRGPTATTPDRARCSPSRRSRHGAR